MRLDTRRPTGCFAPNQAPDGVDFWRARSAIPENRAWITAARDFYGRVFPICATVS